MTPLASRARGRTLQERAPCRPAEEVCTTFGSTLGLSHCSPSARWATCAGILSSDPDSSISIPPLTKVTRITEDTNLEFRAEIFNLFNHPNYGLPVSVLTSPQLWTNLGHGWKRATDPIRAQVQLLGQSYWKSERERDWVEIGESRCLFETTLMVELSDCSTKGSPAWRPPRSRAPFSTGSRCGANHPRAWRLPFLAFRARSNAFRRLLQLDD